MNKTVVALIFILSFSLGHSIQAQSLSIIDRNNQAIINGATITIQSPDNGGWIGFESLDLYIKVINNGFTTMEIGAKKIEFDSLQPDVQHTICFGGACYAASVFVSPNHVTLDPTFADSGFVAHYLFDNRVHVRGINQVAYVFYDANNPNDSVFVNVVYNTQVATGIDQQNKISLDFQLFPNPAKDIINFEFNDGALDNSNLKIIIRNEISEVTNALLPKDHTFSFDISLLPDGIYFCSLLKDDHITSFKKFVVLH